MKNAVRIPAELKAEADSTWLNQGIKTLDQLKEWILIKLGAPLITVELTDQQLNACIGDAIQVYSKYAYRPEQYLVVNLKFYDPELGLDLSQFKVMSVKDISYQRDNIMWSQGDMFFGAYAFMGQGQGSPFFGLGNGNCVGAWTTYQALTEFFSLTKRMLGSNPDFKYDRYTQRLRLMPAPLDSHAFICLTCNVEPPMDEYYGNDVVKSLSLAEAKILLGTIRKKFSGTQLLGSGTIDAEIGEEGKEEKDKIMEDLIKQESKGQCFYVS